MPSSNTHQDYDEKLLESVPKPSKKDIQSGYSLAALQQPEPLPEPVRRTDLESGRHRSVSKHTSTTNRGAVVPSSGEPKPVSISSVPSKKLPFYRTRNGRIAILVVAVVVLAAIIGGAVGGALSKKSKNPTQQTSSHIPSDGSSSSSSSSHSEENGGGIQHNSTTLPIFTITGIVNNSAPPTTTVTVVVPLTSISSSSSSTQPGSAPFASPV